jgi:hypothetical protein
MPIILTHFNSRTTVIWLDQKFQERKVWIDKNFLHFFQKLKTVEINSDSAVMWNSFPMNNPFDTPLYVQHHLLRI